MTAISSSTSASVPVWSYEAEYEEFGGEILAACDRVFRSGRLVMGEEGAAFEQELAGSVGVAGAVGVNSGTDAIAIALAALGVSCGDEVITACNTAVPTVSAIGTIGSIPVLVDVGADCLMDPSLLEAAITPRTRAIVPVHLFGQMADMDAIMNIARKHGLVVVEDVAQAQGASYKGRTAGSIGDAAAFSFYPTKILGGYGDGGAVVSDCHDVLAAARSLRFYGMETTYYAERHGYNSRLDELQAAILRLKLPRLPEWIARRREIATRYDAMFIGNGIRPVGQSADRMHVYHLYVVEVDERETTMARLAERGIGTSVCYRWPIHIMRGYAHLGYSPEDFPVAMAKATRIMNLPIYPTMSDEMVGRVIEEVTSCV